MSHNDETAVDQSTAAQIAQWLMTARRAVVFTGAGMSTESGIPDFRSPGGVWARYQPVYFQDFVASDTARREYWRQKCEAHEQFGSALPNAGHKVLAEWEAAGRLQAVITQNIDGLHQAAGSRRVLELHGSALRVVCLSCAQQFAPEPLMAAFRETAQAPVCTACGGLLKSATVSFGQALPEDVLTEAWELAQQSDLFLVLGSSLVVEPAASLPRLARQNGARLVIVNRDPTEQDRTADAVLRAPLGVALATIQRLAQQTNSAAQQA
ncbi:MAG: NAD-dependent deacetylase [Pirellulales bacterium]